MYFILLTILLGKSQKLTIASFKINFPNINRFQTVRNAFTYFYKKKVVIHTLYLARPEKITSLNKQLAYIYIYIYIYI